MSDNIFPVDDQCFALHAQGTLLWYYIFNASLYGSFASRNAAYTDMQKKRAGARRSYEPQNS